MKEFSKVLKLRPKTFKLGAVQFHHIRVLTYIYYIFHSLWGGKRRDLKYFHAIQRHILCNYIHSTFLVWQEVNLFSTFRYFLDVFKKGAFRPRFQRYLYSKSLEAKMAISAQFSRWFKFFNAISWIWANKMRGPSATDNEISNDI